MKRNLGMFGVIVAPATILAAACVLFGVGNIAMMDEAYPTCTWFDGECRSIYVHYAEAALAAIGVAFAATCFSIAALKGEYDA